jgi:hypothetical protein
MQERMAGRETSLTICSTSLEANSSKEGAQCLVSSLNWTELHSGS